MLYFVYVPTNGRNLRRRHRERTDGTGTTRILIEYFMHGETGKIG